MDIGDEEEALVSILHFDPVLQCSDQMSDMAWAGWAVSG
jgi:hypothetical protein